MSGAGGDRLIVALDVPTNEAALALVEQLGDEVAFYKVGLELFVGDDHHTLIGKLRAMGKRVFLDLKLYDIPNTVARATEQAAALGVDFLTVHGDRQIMAAAVANKAGTRILAVTVLTSFGDQDVADLGWTGPVADLTLRRAHAATEAGCDGVVASPREAGPIRAQLGAGPIILTPGIRPASGRPADDQKRVASAAEAIAAGADYVVVGRPIREAPDPRAAARAVQEEIAAALR